MNRVIILSLALLLTITGGCINITIPEGEPDHNAPDSKSPVARIDSIEPSTASTGQPVAFTGHGTDTDGFIVGYEWQSNIDGVLSTVDSFSTSSLTAGTHTITFRVLNDSQKWSAGVTTQITITIATAPPVIHSFAASPQGIVQGQSSQLQWNVSGTETVTIDNGIGKVPASGSLTVYPSVSTAFTLSATNTGGSVSSTTSITVQESAITGNPVIEFTAQHLWGNSWELNWNVQNAIEITIEPDIGIVDPTGSTVITVPSGYTVTYTLHATNNWGWAYYQVTMAQP